MSDVSGYGYDVERERPDALQPTKAALAFARRPPGQAKRGRRRTIAIFAATFVSLALTAVGLWFFVIRPLGVGTSLVSLTAALVPFTIVMAAIWWLDRYTPQPRFTMAYAFAWGAIGSIALTFILGTAVLLIITLQTQDATAQEFLAVAFQAPVVEEATKSLGLVLLLLFGRRYISGPIDGVIYAMLIAAGFAFTENITYFARSFAEAQVTGVDDVFWQTFLLRGIVSPFAHASFTSLAGLGIGIAAERRSPGLYVVLGLAGLGAGMLLHALWNGGSMYLGLSGATDSIWSLLTWYAAVEVPIFLTLALVLWWLRRRERSIVRERLTEYAEAGWFAPEEVAMLENLRSRRAAVLWARSHGAVAEGAMKEFITASLTLAMHRQGALAGNTSTRIKASEQELLQAITIIRRTLASLTRPLRRVRTMDGR